MSNQGRSIRLFLVDGIPSGLLTAEIVNWTGHALTGPRSRLGDLLKRPECSRTGVYFLVGPDPENPMRSQVYIGESDDVATRLKQHNRPEDKGGKDFWERVCLVTSKDQNLTKAHVKFLESRLIAMASSSGAGTLLNGTAHDYDMLPESDRSDMAFFVEQIRIILPVLGFDFLRDQQKLIEQLRQQNAQPQPAAVFVMEIPKYGIRAEAREVDGEFIVLADSLARDHWASSSNYTSYRPLYNELRENGVLVVAGKDHVRFTRDQVFSSPSAAAAVVSGRSANGRTTWLEKNTRMTYGDWQSAQIEQQTPTDSSGHVMSITG